MEELKQKALNFGATKFGISDKPEKRFFVIYKDKRIDFGSDSRETFFDIKDKQKRNVQTVSSRPCPAPNTRPPLGRVTAE
jgi:hypothetical protein